MMKYNLQKEGKMIRSPFRVDTFFVILRKKRKKWLTYLYGDWRLGYSAIK